MASRSPAGAAAPSGSPVPVPRSRGYSTRRPPSWADLGGVPHNGVIQLLCGSAPSPVSVSVSGARPSPPPLPWGAMSHPPHLPAPTLPLALGHTCLLPRRTVLIWGTVGASLKGETLSRPALCCCLKSQQNTQHWWHPWGLLHVLPGRATIFPRGAFLGRRQASTPAPRTVFLHSWAVTAPRCARPDVCGAGQTLQAEPGLGATGPPASTSKSCVRTQPPGHCP